MNENMKNIAARTMGILFYIVIFISLIGVILKIVKEETTEKIAVGFGFSDILAYFSSFNSSAFFSLGVFVSALSPFILAFIVFIGYLIQKRYKAALLGFILLCSLAVSFFIKGNQ